MSVALEISGLSVESDTGVLLDVAQLSLDTGAVTVITGATDSGKTLLASVLSGLAAAGAGTVRVEGRPLVGGPSARRRLGLAATVANGGRISGCTVGEALRLAGSIRAAGALDRFPLLGARQDVRAELLSGGEQQVLQVACAWCADTRVLVLDAPTTGLASDAAAAVRGLAVDAAAGVAAVLWLDQSRSAAPRGPSWRLIGGVLSSARARGSATGRQT